MSSEIVQYTNIIYKPTKQDNVYSMIERCMAFTKDTGNEAIFCYSTFSKKPLTPIFTGTYNESNIPDDVFKTISSTRTLGVFHTHGKHDQTMFSSYDLYTAFILENFKEVCIGNVVDNVIIVIERPHLDDDMIEFMKNMYITITMDDINFMKHSLFEFIDEIIKRHPDMKPELEELANTFIEKKKATLLYDYNKWYVDNYENFCKKIDKYSKLLTYDVQ